MERSLHHISKEEGAGAGETEKQREGEREGDREGRREGREGERVRCITLRV